MRLPTCPLISLTACALLAGPVAAQASRALQLEDYYALKTVSSPRISPDGRWVAYTVSERIEQDNSSSVETWIARSDGSESPLRIQHDGQDVSEPTWVPEGLRIEDSAGAAWLIDPADVETRATRVPSQAPSGVLSPDGLWRAVVREVERPAPTAPELSDFEHTLLAWLLLGAGNVVLGADASAFSRTAAHRTGAFLYQLPLYGTAAEPGIWHNGSAPCCETALPAGTQDATAALVPEPCADLFPACPVFELEHVYSS